MRGQFGLHMGPPTKPGAKQGWYRTPGSRSKVTYYYTRDGALVAGRTLTSVGHIPAFYASAWARGETEDSSP